MNRIERISSILIQLQSKKVVTAKEIAERFGISLRTVYRDIRALEETGVPIAAEAGIGYSIMEGYRLPPVQFTLAEATAFLTAEKLIEKLTDAGIDRDYKSAMFKIRSILRTTEKDYLETIENNIEVVPNRQVSQENGNEVFLRELIDAIAAGEVLDLTYFALHSEELSRRSIEPVGVFFSAGRWHLIAWCCLRNDYRDFRLDRIRHLVKTDRRFTKDHPSLQSFLNRMKREEDLTEVILEMDREKVRFLGEQKYYSGFISEERGEKISRLTFLTASLDGMAHWYMMIGSSARIVSPPELREKVRALIVRLKKNLDD